MAKAMLICGLIAKLSAAFHEPTAEEIDVFYENTWCKA